MATDGGARSVLSAMPAEVGAAREFMRQQLVDCDERLSLLDESGRIAHFFVLPPQRHCGLAVHHLRVHAHIQSPKKRERLHRLLASLLP